MRVRRACIPAAGDLHSYTHPPRPPIPNQPTAPEGVGVLGPRMPNLSSEDEKTANRYPRMHAPHRMLCLTTCRASPHTMPHHMPHTTHHTTPHMPRAMRHASPHGHAFRRLTCSTLPHTSTYNSSNSPYKNNSSNSPNFKTQIINLVRW